jgi:hypothetical protein
MFELFLPDAYQAVVSRHLPVVVVLQSESTEPNEVERLDWCENL